MLRSFPQSLGLLGSRWTDGLTDGCGSGWAVVLAGQPVRTEVQVRGQADCQVFPLFLDLSLPQGHARLIALTQVAVALEC